MYMHKLRLETQPSFSFLSPIVEYEFSLPGLTEPFYFQPGREYVSDIVLH